MWERVITDWRWEIDDGLFWAERSTCWDFFLLCWRLRIGGALASLTQNWLVGIAMAHLKRVLG